MKKTLFLLFIISLLTINCENKNILNLNSFEGYTGRDFEGFLTGSEDKDDWNLNDDWKKVERNFFDDYDNYNYECEIDTSIKIKALPNPTSENIYINLTKDENVKFDYRIVNEDWEILLLVDDETNNNFYFNIVELLDDEDIVRMYYRFKKDDNCAYIGHGDIKIY